MARGVTLHSFTSSQTFIKTRFSYMSKSQCKVNYGYIICETNVVWINDSKCPCAMSTPLTGIIASEHVDGHVSEGHESLGNHYSRFSGEITECVRNFRVFAPKLVVVN